MDNVGDLLPGPGALNQLAVQELLWRTLPTLRLADDLHELAWALGDHLEELGHPAYAVLCRGQETHAILAAWKATPQEAPGLVDDALAASGVVPRGVSFRFGVDRGPTEDRARSRLSSILEKSRPPVVARERLVDAQLGEGHLRAAIEHERAARWVDDLPGRPEWLASGLPLLAATAVVPAQVELSLAPARALLEVVGHGVVLTPEGRLPLEVVVGLNDRFRWFDVVGATLPGEHSVPLLVALRQHLMAQGLLVELEGRLSVTDLGGSSLRHDETLWSALVELDPRWSGFNAETVALASALTVCVPAAPASHVTPEILRALGDRWWSTGRIELNVARVLAEHQQVATVLGWREARRGRFVDRPSPRGLAAAATAFWSLAAGPRG